VRFEIEPADVPEEIRPAEAPEAFAERLACEKALAVAARGHASRFVLGADTVVVLDGEPLGKPVDPRDAEAMLARLQGRSHRVVTGVALVRGDRVRSLRVESRVHMRPADSEEIRRYVASGEPLDKAGSYAAQGEGRRLIVRIEGSETNVIGLPMDETLRLLAEAGLEWRAP
jgi:septum formation protein